MINAITKKISILFKTLLIVSTIYNKFRNHLYEIYLLVHMVLLFLLLALLLSHDKKILQRLGLN
jgi:hypothetical protein